MTGNFIKMNARFWAAPQIRPADVPEAAAQGVALIVNNRPDGEMLGQPKSAEIEAAAKAAGLAYAYIPVDGRGISMAHLEAFAHALSQAADGPVLGFCKSGLRSTVVYAYASALAGADPAVLIAEAAAAGYDIAGHEPALLSLYNTSQTPPSE